MRFDELQNAQCAQQSISSKWFLLLLLFWFSCTFWIFDIRTITQRPYVFNFSVFFFYYSLLSSSLVITRNTVDMKESTKIPTISMLPDSSCVCHIEIVHKLIQMRRCSSSIPVLVFFFCFKHKRNPFARRAKRECERMDVCERERVDR